MAELDFQVLHEQAISLHANRRPVDVSYPLGRLVSTGGAEISAILEPPAIALTRHTFTNEGSDRLFHDQETEVLSVGDDGRIVGVATRTEQERSYGGEPDRLWTTSEGKLTDLAVGHTLKQVANGLAHALKMEQALGNRS